MTQHVWAVPPVALGLPPVSRAAWRRDVLRAIAEVVLCSGFPTQLAIAAVLSAAGLAALAPNGFPSFTYVVILSFVDAAVLVLLIVRLLHLRGETVRGLLLGRLPIRRETTIGLALTPFFLVAATGGILLIGALAPSLRNVPDNPFAGMLTTPAQVAIFALVAVVAGGLREELQRAFILRRFEQHLGGGWVGLVIFSTAFGLGHALQGWDTAIVTGLLGAAWGAIYLRRRSAVASMVSHAGFNLLQIALAMAAA